MGIEEEDTTEQAAAARRERLKALKAAQQLLENPEDDETHANEDQNGDDENNDVNVKFQNYLPHDKQPQEEKKEDPFLNIAPKQPNWDLRRDQQNKLGKLVKRTLKALYQLMEQQEKEKQLAEENGKDDDSGN
nr:hypothetical protein [Tanacetum cinerariifolium]